MHTRVPAPLSRSSTYPPSRLPNRSGSFSSHHALKIGRILSHIDYLDETIAELSAEIERVITPFSDEVELLDTIPGVNRRVAEVLIAEIGAEMDQFQLLRSALIGAAHAAAKAKGTHLSGRYARINGRRGPKKAAVAVDHSILVIAYHILQRGEPYQEIGGEDYSHRRRSEQEYRKRLVRQLERLGHRVVLEPLPQPA
jgi:transposase